jgi:hypothetical protein
MSRSATVTSIQPILQNALGSLELDLEAELRRYRRHRAAEGSSREISQTAISEHLSGHLNEDSSPVASVDVAAEADTGTAFQSFASVSLPTPENPPAHSAEVNRVLEMLQRPGEGTGSDDLLNLDQTEVLPNDYLESSEELLKSLETDPTQTKGKGIRPAQRLLLIGGGVAVAAIALVAVLVNVLGGNGSNANAPEVAATDGTVVESGTVAPSPAPKTVNLASEEFVDLSLDNLSVVDPNEQEAIAPAPAAKAATPTPQTDAVPNPLAPPSGRDDLASALLPPSLRPQPISSFPVTPQIAAAQAQNSATMLTPDGLKVGFFYVIFKNTSPKSLGKAREAVPSAFVRTFPVGRAIQMAEVNSQAQADALVKKFNDAKIAAEIYHHQLRPAQ